VPEPTDEELDAFILTRMKILGVDLSVLPADDPSAPADRRRILASARTFLRSTPQVIHEFRMEPRWIAPNSYPAARVLPPRLPEGEAEDV